MFRFNLTERALDTYVEILAHRSLPDLNKAYRQVLRSPDRRFMPTPGELLEACGYLRD